MARKDHQFSAALSTYRHPEKLPSAMADLTHPYAFSIFAKDGTTRLRSRTARLSESQVFHRITLHLSPAITTAGHGGATYTRQPKLECVQI